ncbi:hypothetical protein WEI85_25820 [Actinomycetes bacterium KLBMP 9797]
MDWFERRGSDAYGNYADSDSERCPTCYVPIEAPHMKSCDRTGIWRGDEEQPDDR